MSLTADKHIRIIAQCAACMWRMGQHSTTQSKTRPHPTRSEITRQHNIILSFIYTNAYGGLLKLMYVHINNSSNDQYQSHFIFMHEFWTILTLLKYHTYMKFEKIHISQPFPSLDRPIPPISVPSMHQTHFFFIHSTGLHKP